MAKAIIHVDGASAAGQGSGAAAIAQGIDSCFLGWVSRQMPRMTNNEAEYHAALLGLSLAHRLNLQVVAIYSDSEIVVRQVRGQSQVNSPRLRILHQKTCSKARYFDQVSFHHIPREENRLADALAADALKGRTVGQERIPRQSLRGIWRRIRKER